MEEDISAERLFEMLNEEKKTGELLPLPKNFYSLAETYAKHHNSIEREKDNLEKILRSLKTRRTQKILVYLAYNKNLPSPVPSEEEALYSKLRKILSEEPNSSRPTKIKIFSDVPEILMPNGKKIGPFKQNEIIELEDGTDTQFVLNNKLGEII